MNTIELEVRRAELVRKILNETDEIMLDELMSFFRNLKKRSLQEDIPEGYMSSSDFWKESRSRIDNICKKHGLLQETGAE
jgi:nicotinate-nucleotide pyrophosphorylase